MRHWVCRTATRREHQEQVQRERLMRRGVRLGSRVSGILFESTSSLSYWIGRRVCVEGGGGANESEGWRDCGTNILGEHSLGGHQTQMKGTEANEQEDTSHVPCKFFRQGACQAGKACPFSHDLASVTDNVCKYFAKVRTSLFTQLTCSVGTS